MSVLSYKPDLERLQQMRKRRMGMDSLTVYDVEERVPVHTEWIWMLRVYGLCKGRVEYPYKSDKDQYKEDYYTVVCEGDGYQSLKGEFSKYILSEEVKNIFKK